MSDDPTPLLQALIRIADPGGTGTLPGSGRLATPRLTGGIASLVIDATGLSGEQRATLERQIRAALAAVPEVTEVRVAMTADKVERTII
ncbi:MAG TPA: chromosome partitioning protein ParA, partial [Allosphingosinicella sp.]